MKSREIYAEMRCVPPVVVRADGRNFRNTLSGLGFKKPYDENFARAVADTAELFIKKSGLSPISAYTFSDEISFLFMELPFEGRVEKIDSIAASFLGSTLTINLQLKEPVAFDSRIIALQKEEIPLYFHWRQLEAWRNFVSGWAYYTLRKEGMNKSEASKYLKGKKEWQIHELLFERGINLATLPAWQRRGIIISSQSYEISGFNPVLGKETKALRSRVIQNWEIPNFGSEAGKKFLQKLININ